MGRPQNLETRRRILECAVKLFHQRGFRGVSMDDVAEAAGLKKANLFHYYPSKEELGLAAVARGAECQRDKVLCGLAGAREPLKAVDRFFEQAIEEMRSKRCEQGCLIGNLAQELSDHNERLREKVSACLCGWTAALGDFLDGWRARGYFRPGFDACCAAESLVSLLEGAILLSKATRTVRPLEHARRMASGYLAGWRK